MTSAASLQASRGGFGYGIATGAYGAKTTILMGQMAGLNEAEHHSWRQKNTVRTVGDGSKRGLNSSHYSIE